MNAILNANQVHSACMKKSKMHDKYFNGKPQANTTSSGPNENMTNRRTIPSQSEKNQTPQFVVATQKSHVTILTMNPDFYKIPQPLGESSGTDLNETEDDVPNEPDERAAEAVGTGGNIQKGSKKSPSREDTPEKFLVELETINPEAAAKPADQNVAVEEGKGIPIQLVVQGNIWVDPEVSEEDSGKQESASKAEEEVKEPDGNNHKEQPQQCGTYIDPNQLKGKQDAERKGPVKTIKAKKLPVRCEDKVKTEIRPLVMRKRRSVCPERALVTRDMFNLYSASQRFRHDLDELLFGSEEHTKGQGLVISRSTLTNNVFDASVKKPTLEPNLYPRVTRVAKENNANSSKKPKPSHDCEQNLLGGEHGESRSGNLNIPQFSRTRSLNEPPGPQTDAEKAESENLSQLSLRSRSCSCCEKVSMSFVDTSRAGSRTLPGSRRNRNGGNDSPRLTSTQQQYVSL